MSSFGNHLKKLRNIAGLSQQKLADKMDVSKNTVQNWENGAKIDYGKLPDLASIFNTSIEDLIGEYCREQAEKRPSNWPGFLFDNEDDINETVKSLHLNLRQQDLFGLLYIYKSEYLQKDDIDFDNFYDDLKLVPYDFIEKVGSIQFMNCADGLHNVIKYVKSDFLLKILKEDPEAEFDVMRLTKGQICDFIDKGYKEAWDDMEWCENVTPLKFNISMERAQRVLPILKDGPIHITDGHWSNKVRKDVPAELIESLHLSLGYKEWVKKYDKLNPNDLGNGGGCMKRGLERVTVYHNTAPDGEEETWYLEINEKGRLLLEWFDKKGE